MSSLSLFLPVVASSQVPTPGQVSVSTTALIQTNASKGGTIAIGLPDPRAIPLQIDIKMGNGRSLSAPIPIPDAARMQKLTVTVSAEPKDGAIQTRVGYELADSPRPANHATGLSVSGAGGASAYLGEKPFTWTVVDGIYKLGQPCLLGTIAGKTVTVTISPIPPAKVPKRK